MSYIGVGAAYCIYVFLRAFQQRNVVFNHYTLVMPFSLGMAAIDVLVISSIAYYGFKWGFVFAIGLGGGIGCLLAMYVHERWLHK